MKMGLVNAIGQSRVATAFRFGFFGGVVLLALLSVTSGSPRAAGTFEPSVTLELSTNRATSHPDARITIDNLNSSEEIRNLSLSLPTGFWGSLAAAEQCDFADAQQNQCSQDSQIGTVDSIATIDQSTARLRGKVYLTTAAPANDSTDPAGLTVIVPAEVGSVDLGDVIVNARVQVRNAAVSPTATTGAVGAVQGVNTVVNDIPRSITDTNSRTVEFHLDRMVVDLKSDLDGPRPPLLTNPSTCGSITLTGEAESWDSSSQALTDAVPEVITGCSDLRLDPTMQFSLTSPAAGTNTGLNAEISLPDDSPSLKTVTTRLPMGISPSFPAFGEQADQCTAAAAPNSSSPFAPSVCPAQSKVGRVTIETPLIDQPLEGDVYLIAKSPVPWLGIDVSPSTAVTNPAGVTLRLVGVSSLPQLDPTCTGSFFACGQYMAVTFNNVPDAPVTNIELELDGPSRTGVMNTLSGQILAVATAGDPSCMPEMDIVGQFTSNAGNAISAARVNEVAISGCSPQAIEIPSGVSSPVGTVTSDNRPTVPFVENQPGPTDCFFNTENAMVGSCSSPFGLDVGDPNLPNGLNRVFFSNGGTAYDRAFVVQPTPSTPDTTAPETTLDDGPPAQTSDTTPTFDFSADGTSNFQCAIGPGSSVAGIGAFLPCGTSSTTGSYTVPNNEALVAGLQYTFAVRAQDSAGNTDLTPASATFTIDIPFAPTFTADVSTPVARAHPDLDIEILNPSNEDIEDLEFNLPDGFFGGLTGVASLCSIASADAGACTASSKVGTVETEAAVDESTIRITGDVFLTEPRNPSTEPASLSIKIEPAIQDVVFNDIIVNASLKIRGVAEGIDTFALDLPNSASSTLDGTTEFDLRRMKISLRTGTGAPYPLLTNPSACGTATFNAKFGGYDDSATTESDSFDVIGCDALGFAPQLGISMVDGKTGKAPGPGSATNAPEINLTANLTADPNGAGIKRVSLLMPKPVTINVLKIPFACAQAQADLKACPPSAAIGTVSATSPLLNEPLQGTVYLLQQLPGEAIPRLLLALRGRINVDIIANNSFENQTQIRTVFDVLPDVPLSSFAMTINGFLTTRNEACEYSPSIWNAVGDMTGFNNKTAPINIPLDFSCNKEPVFTSKFVNRGKKSTLSMTAKPGAGKKLKKLTLTLPRGVKFTKAGFSKKKVKKLVIVRADGRRLAAKCFKLRRANRLEINLCGRQALTVTLSLKAGTLTATKRVKKPKLKLQVLQSDNLAANALAVK